jgi:DNA-binding MarR family transcriptional regulator
MVEGQRPLEEAILQMIKDGKGSIDGLKELAKEYNITVGELTEPIKKLSEKNMITVLETDEGSIKLFIKEKK